MTGFIGHWRLCWLLGIACGFYLQQVTHGKPGNAGRIQRVEISDGVFVEDSRRLNETSGAPSRAAERRERFCLNRLKDALRTVCSSGTGRTPLFYSPIQFYSSNGTEVRAQEISGTKKHLRNDIPTMVEAPRRLLRRRSRRNIVRECCNNPCSYANLLKYCSPSVRLSDSFHERFQPDNQPDSLTKLKQMGLSRNTNSAAEITVQDQPSCFPSCGNVQSELEHHRASSPTTSQCYTIADLKTLYFKLLLRKQWTKEEQQALGVDIDNAYDTNRNSAYGSNPKSNYLRELSNNAYSIATNQMAPSHFIDQINPIHLNPTDWQTTASTETSSSDGRIDNAIDIITETQVQKRPHQTSNAVTARPITGLINLPSGTNDYLY